MDYFNVNKQYAFGIDLSVYNGSADGKRRPDFDRIAAHQPRVAFAALRAGLRPEIGRASCRERV